MRTRILLLFSSLLLLGPLGCSQQSTMPGQPLPEPALTYSGLGMFGFSEAGTLIASNNRNLKQSLASAGYFSNNISIELSWVSISGASGSINLIIDPVAFVPQEYQIGSTSVIGLVTSSAPAYATFQYNDSTRPAIVSGLIDITTFDTINNVISGRFRFYYQTSNSSAIGTVDSGYFNNVPIASGSFGQGTISALVDGQPLGLSNYARGSVIAVMYGDSALNFQVSDTLRGMQINISNPKLDSTYNLAGYPRLTNANYSYFIPMSSNNDSSFTVVNDESWNGSGSLTITKFDTVARRISATFNFIGVADTIHESNVSNGVINNVLWFVQ